MFAHGGAWTNGYKEWMGLMAPALTAAGIVLVSVSYRLAPEHKWDAMLGDCLGASAWVYRNIARHGGNPERIAIGGHSAGGHLTMLAALQRSRLFEFGIPPRAIVACLPLCAPLDIRYPQRLPGSGEDLASPVSKPWHGEASWHLRGRRPR
ncbi:alpha/beta hydrolase [Cupriavidus gilardii]|uniref:Alpha/beta hydrolase n=1 Tax=Cupriavidus gilardii TaxID=82541 RepID=A0ABY4VRJ4_9BURK|nr:alpha/beta hydrolase [Cupriavidus gilardii]USE78396.1 alpha/beta hydrolase [Cupriavidus gilardii]